MRLRLALLAAFVAAALAGTGPLRPVTAAGLPMWTRPVPGRVVRVFEPPMTRYGRGHLGVDLAAAPGTTVRSAGAGTVVFAGAVAGTRHVVIRHPGGLRTSYSFLASIRVRLGEVLVRGAVLGTTGGTGEGHDGNALHLGLRIGDTYVDPMRLFDPPDLAAVVHLAPTTNDPGPAVPASDGERRSLAMAFGAADAPSEVPVPSRPSTAMPEELVASGRRTPDGMPIFPR